MKNGIVMFLNQIVLKFDLKPAGYIDGNPAVDFGYSKSIWAPQVVFNPLNILNRLQNKI